MTCSISVLILTYNEEVNLRDCIKSVVGWADEIVIVDSFSNDRTESIAREYPITYIQHAYESAPAQWDWALNNLSFRNDWIFALDADFRVSEELKTALSTELPTLLESIRGLYVRHRQVFRGRFIRHGGIYPRYWLRVFRLQFASVDSNELVDQHYYVSGETKRIEFDIIEDNRKERDLGFWVAKQLRFAERAAIEELRRRNQDLITPIQPSVSGSSDQRTLWLKKQWYRFPLFWRSVVYFLYRYFFRLGFLDGKEGFLYHLTQCLLYRVAVDSYIDEFSTQRLSEDELRMRLKPIGPTTPTSR